MLHVVCYDISEDNIRNRLSERLLNFGTRIQDSVFECLLDETLYARMLEQIEEIKLDAKDRVRIYRMCLRCVETIRIYGPGEVTTDPAYYLV